MGKVKKVLLGIGISIGVLFAISFALAIYSLQSFQPDLKSPAETNGENKNDNLLPPISEPEVPKTPVTKSEMLRTYSNNDYAFSIQYPSDWTYDENIPANIGIDVPVSFTAPLDDFGHTSNVIIGVENIQGLDFEEYVKETNQNIAEIYSSTDYTFLGGGKVVLDNRQSYYFEHAISLPFSSKIKQVIVPNGDDAYIISFTASKFTYDEHVKIFNRMLSTFRSTEPPSSPILTKSTSNTDVNNPSNGEKNHASASDVILSSAAYLDTLGYLHIPGLLQNNSPNLIEYVNIIATFYGADKNVVGTSSTYTYVDTLRPKEKSAFEIILFDVEQSSKSKSYKLLAQWQGGSVKPAMLQLSFGDSYFDAIGAYHLVGEVTNKGSSAATFVDVSGAFLDNQGKIIATSDTYTQPYDLEPGQKAPFELVVFAAGATRIESYSVNVDSSEYSMISP